MSGLLVTIPATPGAEDRPGPEGAQEDGSTEIQAWVTGSPWWDLPGCRPGEEADPRRRLLRAWAGLGERLLDSVRGHFSFVLVDSRARRALLAIDRMGIGTLAWARSPSGTLVAGTSALDVARHPAIGATLSAQALHDYMLFHMVPSPDTVFSGVSKLQPGWRLSLADGQLDCRRYWHPAFARRADAGPGELGEELLAIMESSVGRACVQGATNGAFLSGGLDSSSVVGMLSRIQPDAAAFTVGFPAEGYDEREYARIAARHFGVTAHEFVMTPAHVAEALPMIAAEYDEPFGNSSAVPAYFCARFAREHGVERLLAGDGGDELFGGNPHYGRQLVLDTYHHLPRPVRSVLCEGLLLRAIPDGAPFPFGKLRSYIDQARQPLPARLQSWSFMRRHEAGEIFSPAFLAQLDPGHADRLMDTVYAESAGEDLVNRLLAYDWQFVLADSDLRKVNRMCALAGIEVAYPMLDDALVDFSLRLPGPMKTTRKELRTFFKQATRDFLPPETINKNKHGFGLPFGVWLRTAPELQGLMQDALSGLARREIFSAAWLGTIANRHEQGHAAWHGTVIWDLIMMEQWLESHGY